MGTMVRTTEIILSSKGMARNVRSPNWTRKSRSINEKIYQKIQSKCYEGTASTYVRIAAEFDGHGVGTRLRTRYHGYSTQKLKSYKKLTKELRHTSGTSMPVHIDRFETIIGHMPGCGYIPTTTEKVDWFLPSVGEALYAAAKAHCQAKKLAGGLEYADMIKLYNYTCFEKYPHFQLAELQSSSLSQSSNRIGVEIYVCLPPEC